MTTAKKLNLKERYQAMTRGLSWETSYQPMDKVFPYDKYEGIKIKDWSKWEDPFRLTMDAYWKYQAEKERKLYAILDAFSQNNGHLNLSDARYLSAIKLWIQGITPIEYQASRGYAHLARAFRGAGASVACQMQCIDELRHAQTQLHGFSQYNKFFNGMRQYEHIKDRAWYLSIPKSFFEDAFSGGPFELITAISFAFEYVLTNLLFMPFVSGAAYNGDMATTTFGFSAQSDESRHMTLGLEVIKFILEQHEDNVPIMQRYIDKWFWRGYRLLSLVGAMLDYLLPKKVMSWGEAWEQYWEQNGMALFHDLARYGIRPPKYHEWATAEKNKITHEAWATLYHFGHALSLHTWIPENYELDWLSEKYGAIFDTLYRPRLEEWRGLAQQGKRFYNNRLPLVCQVCQIPIFFTEPNDPSLICIRESNYQGMKYQTCSDGCRDIFEFEPAKYIQAYIPPMQIYQGNCEATSVAEYATWLRLDKRDFGDYEGSDDQKNWRKWKEAAALAASSRPLAAE